MTEKKKQVLLEKARKVLRQSEFIEYTNFLNNYEYRTACNDERLQAKYGRIKTHTL